MNNRNFSLRALEIFRFQALYNPLYSEYIRLLGIKIEKVKRLNQIPYLPIHFFKTHIIKTGDWPHQKFFRSSGTTGQQPSKHFIEDIDFYNKNALRIFEWFFGSITKFCFIALLPSYLETGNSSLIHMINHFIHKSGSILSGFYNYTKINMEEILNRISNKDDRKPVIWGVTYALLDLAATNKIPLKDVILIETGGMKGRRKELVRDEVHEILIKQFGVKKIHSEYGMTELMSQAYSKSGGLFQCPPWMKILIRDVNDPFNINNKLRYGAVNIIDLANIHSCCFISTQDLGKVNDNGQFEILGRMDNSDLRGCNLLLN